MTALSPIMDKMQLCLKKVMKAQTLLCYIDQQHHHSLQSQVLQNWSQTAANHLENKMHQKKTLQILR